MKWIMFNDSIHPVNPVMETVENLLDIIKRQQETLDRVLDIIKGQHDSIQDLQEQLYELAPEYELIETMAEDDEEKRRMLDLYMNHCDNYVEKTWEK